MPWLHQGRMFNRLTGQRARRLFEGRRPRRASHIGFRTQVSPYGAAGGGRGQYHAGHAGHAGNVYSAMLAQAQSGRGTNMGMLHHTPGYRGTRMAFSFRDEQAKIKRDYRGKLREQRKLLRGDGADKKRIRGQLAQLRGQYRTDRRQAAAGWSKKNQGASPRFGINVRQNPYSGGRFNTGFRFRRQQGSQQAHLERAQKRNMRPYFPTNADFTRGGRRRGSIQVGDHWRTGPHARTVRRTATSPVSVFGSTRSTRRPMNPYETRIAGGGTAPWAREFIRNQNPDRATDRYIDYAMSERPTYRGWMDYQHKNTK